MANKADAGPLEYDLLPRSQWTREFANWLNHSRVGRWAQGKEHEEWKELKNLAETRKGAIMVIIKEQAKIADSSRQVVSCEQGHTHLLAAPSANTVKWDDPKQNDDEGSGHLHCRLCTTRRPLLVFLLSTSDRWYWSGRTRMPHCLCSRRWCDLCYRCETCVNQKNNLLVKVR